MTFDPNSTGSVDAKEVAAWVATHAATGSGSGVPSGGTTGQVLDKLSSADGDAGWADPALASNATPAVASGSGTPGVGTSFARDDHVHPAQSVVGVMDAYPIPVPTTTTSGDTYPSSAGFGSNVGIFSDSRAQGWPIRVSNNCTVKIGLKIGIAGASGSVIRIGVFTDNAKGTGAGALSSDLGTIDSSSTGIKFTTSSIALNNATRYWIVCASQGSAASQPQMQGMNGILLPLMCIDGSNNAGLMLRYTFAGAMSSNPTLGAVDANVPYLLYLQVP